MVRVPNGGSVRFLNLIIHNVNGEQFGPYSGIVCFVKRSDTRSPLYTTLETVGQVIMGTMAMLIQHETTLCYSLCANAMLYTSTLKGLAQDKIIKQSVILFWLLNMTI